MPTLALKNGAIMTEKAAIALMVLDRCPDLAPPSSDRQNVSNFNALLIWFVANVYPTLPMPIILNAAADAPNS